MIKTQKIYNTALEHMQNYLIAHNMRVTVERKMVLEQICLLKQPFTAQQLTEACLAQRLSRGTVYNNLELFLSAQILHAFTRQTGRIATEYELTNQPSPRLQFICTKCGRTVDMHDKAIERMIRERKYSNFELQTFSLTVYGQCKICRSSKRRNIGK